MSTNDFLKKCFKTFLLSAKTFSDDQDYRNLIDLGETFFNNKMNLGETEPFKDKKELLIETFLLTLKNLVKEDQLNLIREEIKEYIYLDEKEEDFLTKKSEKLKTLIIKIKDIVLENIEKEDNNEERDTVRDLFKLEILTLDNREELSKKICEFIVNGLDDKKPDNDEKTHEMKEE